MLIDWDSLKSKREKAVKELSVNQPTTKVEKMSDRFQNPTFKRLALANENGINLSAGDISAYYKDLDGINQYLNGGKYSAEGHANVAQKAKDNALALSKQMAEMQKAGYTTDSAVYANAKRLEEYYARLNNSLSAKNSVEDMTEQYLNNSASQLLLLKSNTPSFHDANAELARLNHVKDQAGRRGDDTSAYDRAIGWMEDYLNHFGFNDSTSPEDRIEIYDKKKRELDQLREKYNQGVQTHPNNTQAAPDEPIPYYDGMGDYIDDRVLSDEETARFNELDAELRAYRKKYPDDVFYKYRSDPNFSVLAKQREGKTDDLTYYLDEHSTWTTADEFAHGTLLGRALDPLFSNAIASGYKNSWHKMTEHEKDVYYYLLNAQGKDAASEYLDSLSETLQKRTTEENRRAAENSEGLDRIVRTISSVLDSAVGGVTGYAEDLANLLSGNEITPYSPAHQLALGAEAIRASNAEGIDKATGGWNIGGFTLGDLYQAAMSTADSVAGFYTLGPVGYGITMGMGAARSKAKELYDKGASAEQIFLESTAAGAFELLFESVSLDVVANKIISGMLTKKASTINFIKSALLSAGVEGSEEVFTDIANYAADILIMGDKSERQQLIKEYLAQGYSQEEAERLATEAFLQDLWKSGASGFFSGLFGGSAFYGKGAYEAAKQSVNESIITPIQEKRDTREYVKQNTSSIAGTEGGADAVMQAAQSIIADESITGKEALQKAVNKVASMSVDDKGYNKAVARVAAEVEKSQRGELKGSYTRALNSVISDTITELAPDGADLSVLEGITRKVYNSEELTKAEQKVYADSAVRDAVDKAVTELKSDAGSEKIANATIENAQAAVDKIQETRVKSGVAKVDTGYNDTFSVADSGENLVNDKPVTVQKFTDVSSDDMTVQLDDGTQVKASDISWGDSNLPAVFGSVLRLQKTYNTSFTPAFVNTVYQAYQLEKRSRSTQSKGFRGDVFAWGVEQAFDDGYVGKEYHGDILSAEAAKMITDAAHKMREENSAKADAERKQEAKKAKKEGKQAREGSVTADDSVANDKDGGIDKSKLNPKQKVSVEVVERLAKALRVDFVLFRSRYVDGKWVSQYSKEGENSPNGFYKDGKIYVDLNAGINGEGLMLFTVSHELVHFMRSGSKQSFDRLADFLVKNYGTRGTTLAQYIAGEMSKGVSKDVAYEEVVARLCESFLTDIHMSDKVEALYKTDRSLCEKIRDFLRDIGQKIKAAFAGAKPQSELGRIGRDISQKHSEVLDLFIEGIHTASENLAYIENTTGKGGVKQQNRYSYDDFVAKPDMEITIVDDAVAFSADAKTRKRVIDDAVKNAKEVGKTNANGNAVVHVGDINSDIVVSKRSVTHGLDRRLEVSAPVIVKIGDILKNSILLNEMTPKQNTASGSYVLVGYAEGKEHNYVVRFVVNQYSNEVDSVDVLYAVNTKREPAGNTPGGHISAPPTGSKISIRDLLDYVNRNYPQLLPEDVLKHYGYDARPDGELSDSVLYQSRASDWFDDDDAFLSEDDEIQDVFARHYLTHSEAIGEVLKNTADIEIAPGTVKNIVSRVLRAELGNVDNDTKRDLALRIQIELENAKNADPEKIVDNMIAAVRKVIQDMKIENAEAVVQYDQLKAAFNGKYYLTDEQLADLKENDYTLGRLRNELMGKVNIVSKDTAKRSINGGYADATELSFEGVADSFTNGNFEQIFGISADEWDQYGYHAPMMLLQAFEDLSAAREIELTQRASSEDMDGMAVNLAAKITGAIVQQKYNSRHNPYVSELVDRFEQRKREAVKKRNEYYADQMKKLREQRDQRYAEQKEKSESRRKKDIENRAKNALKRSISSLIGDLDKVLMRSSGDKTVKQELRKSASGLLQVSRMLFPAVRTVEEMATQGVEVASSSEKRLLELYASLLSQRDEKGVTQQQREDINKRLASLRNNGLKDLIYRERALYDEAQRQSNEVNIKAAITEIVDAYRQIENASEAYLRDSYEQELVDLLNSFKDELGNKTAKDLTYTELEDFHRVMTMMLTSIRNANKLFNEKVKGTIETCGRDTIREIKSIRNVKEAKDKLATVLSRLGVNNLKPIYVCRYIGSKTFEDLFWGLQSGECVFATDIAEAKEFKESVEEKYKYKGFDFNKKIQYTSVNGDSFELDLNQRMALFATARRPQGLQHLINEGFTFESGDDVSLTKRHSGAKAYPLSPETVKAISDSLSTAEKAFAIEMQSYLSLVMGEKGNEVSMKLYGVKLFNEDTYWSLKSNDNFIPKNELDSKGQFKLKNSGFTKAINRKATNPIVLRGFEEAWSSHVYDMAMYHAMTLPLEDINKVFNYRTRGDESSEGVKSVIQGAFSGSVVSYINDLINDLNGGAVLKNRVRISDKLIALSKKGSVLGNLSVIVQQPSAIFRAMAYVDKRYFLLGMTKGTAKAIIPPLHIKDWEEMKKYAPVVIIKEMGTFDTGTGRGVMDYLSSGARDSVFRKIANKGDDLLVKLPDLADRLAWIQLWHAVQRETQAKHGYKVGTEQNKIKSGERFNEVIHLTQVYDSTLSRSGNMRGGSVEKALTAFMAEPLTYANMAFDAWVQANRMRNTSGFWAAFKHFNRVGISISATIIANSLLHAIVAAMRDDDDDEEFAEKYKDALLTDLLDGVNPLNYLPIARDVMSILEGYKVNRMDMNLILDAYKTISKKVDKLNKGQDLDGWDIMEMIGAASAFGGVPVKNLTRDVRSVINTYSVIKNRNTAPTKDEIAMAAMEKYQSAYGKAYDEGYSEEDCKKKAEQAARTYISYNIKPEYLQAIREKDYATANDLRSFMYRTGYYKKKGVSSLSTVDDLLESWRKSAEEEKKREKVAEERKNNN